MTRSSFLTCCRITCLISLLLLTDGEAEEKKGTSKILEIQRLKEEIYSINLINLLGLNADQIDVILAQSELARPLIETYAATLPEIYAFQFSAFSEFKKEDEEDQGFSPQVEWYAAKATRLEKRLKEKMIGRLNTLAEPVRRVLTEDQRYILEIYEPVLFPEDRRRGRYDPSLQWRLDTVRETLREAVDLSDGRFKREKDRLIRRIVNTLPKHSIRGGLNKNRRDRKGAKRGRERSNWFEDRDEAHERIEEILDELRRVPEETREGAIEEVLATKIFPTKVQQMVREMHEIHQSKHPRLSQAARFLLNPDAAAYLKKMKTGRTK